MTIEGIPYIKKSEVSIKRCPYCKALIDEGATHCANCGTRLIFPEDEAIEEEIPGEKIIEEPPKKKKRTRRKKKPVTETEGELKEIEVVEEEIIPAEDSPVIQMGEEEAEELPSEGEGETEREKIPSEEEMVPEAGDSSELEDGEEELPEDEEPDTSVPDEIDEFLGSEDEESVLEDDELLLEEIEETDSDELGETSEPEQEWESEEADSAEDDGTPEMDLDKAVGEDLVDQEEASEIDLEEETGEEIPVGGDEVEEIESVEESDLMLQEDEEEEAGGEDEASEGTEESVDLEEHFILDEEEEPAEEADVPVFRDSSKPLPEEPYRRTQTKEKMASAKERLEEGEPSEETAPDEPNVRPSSYRTGEQMSIFDPIEKEKEDIEKFLDSLKRDRRARRPPSQTDEMPPWAAEIKSEERMAEEMISEVEEQAPAGKTRKRGKAQAKAPSPEPESPLLSKTAEQKFYVETDDTDLFADKSRPSPLLQWLKCRLLDVIFVLLLWAISLFGASLVLGVPFVRLIASSPWVVSGFFVILLVQYFFLFNFFLGSTLGTRLFNQKD